MSAFKEKVIQAVQSVPYGKVASYGQIALMIGYPRAARQVGWTLNSLEDSLILGESKFPWWRIVNNQGRISIKGTKVNDAVVQKKLLEEEGLNISDDLTFDIEYYRYRPTEDQLKHLKLDDEYIYKVLNKFSILG